MADCMTFPEDWRDFLRDYSFRDSEEVYTNGSELISVFRVEQLIEHLTAEQEPHAHWTRITGMAPPEYHGHHICSICGAMAPMEPPYGGREELALYCPGCGAKMEEDKDD